MIRGLTLTHPWAYAIARLGKDIENRTWRPEQKGGKVGMFLAIHGGVVPGKNTGKREEARMDLAAALGMAGLEEKVGEKATLRLRMGFEVEGEEAYFTPGIVAVARLAGVSQGSRSVWAASGQHHWQLADVVALPEAVPHRGAQGLWTLEPDALANVRAHWKATTAPATAETHPDPAPLPAATLTGQVCATCGHGSPDGYGMVECQLGWEAHDNLYREPYRPEQRWEPATMGHPGVPLPLLAPQTKCMAVGGRWALMKGRVA